MQGKTLEQTLTDLRAYLEVNDAEGAIRLLAKLRPVDQADLFGELSPEDQTELLPQLDVEDSADILEALPDDDAADLAERLPPEDLARIVNEMEPDEAADLLRDIEPQHADETLAEMKHADEVRPLLLHRDETAGGLMTTEMLVLRVAMTAQDALNAVRQWAPSSDVVYYLFVVDAEQRLAGVLSLRDLVVADPGRCIAELMDRQVISVYTGTDQEDCARLMQRYDLLALPVVEDTGKLVGIITHDDLVDVLQEEATEDMQRFGGAQPLGRPYLSAGVFSSVSKRIGWLLLLLFTGMLTGTVLRHFEHLLDTVVALSFFVPLLIGAGGNAGTQTTSTVIRAVALGEIRVRDAFRVLFLEMRAGIILGLVMAVVAYFRAILWGTTPQIGLAVALSIMTIVVWANCVGALLPLIATKLRLDPTVVSGPLMSTVVDATGLLLYCVIAQKVLGL